MSKSLRDAAPKRKPSTPSKKRTATKSASKSSTKSARPWESPEWEEAVRQTPGLKPFFDNLESFVELPEGVKKLREMVLGLAVRGKLVPQDSSDESATQLLEDVQEKRDRLLEAGAIRKRKPLASDQLGELKFPIIRGRDFRVSKILWFHIVVSGPRAPSGIARPQNNFRVNWLLLSLTRSLATSRDLVRPAFQFFCETMPPVQIPPG